MLKTVWKLCYHSKCLPGLTPEGIFLTTAHSGIILFLGSPPQTAAGLALPLEQPHEDVGEVKGNQRSLQNCLCSPGIFVKWGVWKAVGHLLHRGGLGRKGLLHWEGVAVLVLMVCDDLSCSATRSSNPTGGWRFLYCPSHPSHCSLCSLQPHSCRKTPVMAQKQCECPHQHCSSLLARRRNFAVEYLPNLPKHWQDAASSILPAPLSPALEPHLSPWPASTSHPVLWSQSSAFLPLYSSLFQIPVAASL